MIDILRKFEKRIVQALVWMMMLVVFLLTLELGWIIVKDIFTEPVILLDIDEFLEIFGFFLLVLIGIELLETMKAYLSENVIHMRIVLEVALIAIARKVIIVDIKTYDGLGLAGMAVLIASVALAFYMTGSRKDKSPELPPGQ